MSTYARTYGDPNGYGYSYIYTYTNSYSDVHAHSDPDGYTNSDSNTDINTYAYSCIRRGRLQSRRWGARSQLDEAAGVGKQPAHRQQPGRGGFREQPQLCLLVG